MFDEDETIKSYNDEEEKTKGDKKSIKDVQGIHEHLASGDEEVDEGSDGILLSLNHG